MKRILVLILLLAAGAVGCATAASPAEHPRLGFAASDGGPQWLGSLPAVVGNNQTITLYDSTVTMGPRPERIVVTAFVDQGITILYRTKAAGSSTWRTVNGSGIGDTITASTFTAKDYYVVGPNSQIQAVTGGTGPTANEVQVALVFTRTLAQ